MVCVPAKRSITLELTPEAEAALQALQARTRVTKKAITEKVFGWFAEQDQIVQGLILDHVPDELRRDAVRRMLCKLEKPSRVEGEAETITNRLTGINEPIDGVSME